MPEDARTRFTGGSPDAKNTNEAFAALTDNSNHQFVSNVSLPTVRVCVRARALSRAPGWPQNNSV